MNKTDYHREYRKEHPEKFKEAAKRWYKKNGKSDSRRFSVYRSNAKSNGRDFELTKEQFAELRNQECFYCGDKRQPNGIDRIDNSLGYVMTNVVTCCKRCNYMKIDMAQNEFINQCKLIASRS